MGNNPLFNGSGCKDATAFKAIKSADKDIDQENKKVGKIIGTIKSILDFTEFELVGRIELRNKKTGKEFK